MERGDKDGDLGAGANGEGGGEVRTLEDDAGVADGDAGVVGAGVEIESALLVLAEGEAQALA